MMVSTAVRRLQPVILACATCAGSVALLLHGGLSHSLAGWGQLNAVSGLLAAGATLPLVAWRRSPFGVFMVTAGASTVLSGLGYAADPMLGPTLALYLAAASRDSARPWTWAMTLAVVGLLVAYLAATATAIRGFPSTELPHAVLGWAVAWFAGDRTRLRREQVAELRRLAAAEERARIARDLHDPAGHAISVIAVRAGAARLRHVQDPEHSVVALKAIEELARKTAAEIDEIVHTLRSGDSPEESARAPIGLASLEGLIATSTAGGLKVSVETRGERRPLSASADQATYRILQESLTNATRHGNGRAEIVLSFGDGDVELEVTNPVGLRRSSREGGHGLAGMRERATRLGGSLEYERANGAFRVRARIPYGATSG